MGLGYLSLSLGVRTINITPVKLSCMVKMLLHWWCFVPTAWHSHNCEWTSSHSVLNKSCQNLIVGVSTDDFQQYCIIHCSRKYLTKEVQSIGWILGPFACVFVRLFVCLLCFYVVILNIVVFLIYSMLKCLKEIVMHFVLEQPSSSDLVIFCQVVHGGY